MAKSIFFYHAFNFFPSSTFSELFVEAAFLREIIRRFNELQAFRLMRLAQAIKEVLNRFCWFESFM